MTTGMSTRFGIFTGRKPTFPNSNASNTSLKSAAYQQRQQAAAQQQQHIDQEEEEEEEGVTLQQQQQQQDVDMAMDSGGEAEDLVEIDAEDPMNVSGGGGAGGVNDADSGSGALSMEDAYNILTDIGYSGKQSLHAPDARILPRAGQVYLFYFPVECKPFKRLRIDDTLIWHNKSRAFHPRNQPKMVRVTYRTSGPKPGAAQADGTDVTTRKAYWLAVAEENNENAVVLIEYLRDTPQAGQIKTENGVGAAGKPMFGRKQSNNTQQAAAAATQQQPAKKVLVEPLPDATYLARPPMLPKKRLFEAGSMIVSLNSSASTPHPLGLTPATAANVQTREQMIGQVQEALKYVQEYKDYIWDLEGNLRSIYRDLVDMATEDQQEEAQAAASSRMQQHEE